MITTKEELKRFFIYSIIANNLGEAEDYLAGLYLLGSHEKAVESLVASQQLRPNMASFYLRLSTENGLIQPETIAGEHLPSANATALIEETFRSYPPDANPLKLMEALLCPAPIIVYSSAISGTDTSVSNHPRI